MFTNNKIKELFFLLAVLAIFQARAQVCFYPTTIYTVNTGAQNMGSADFNGDGFPDLAVIHPTPSPGKVGVMLNNGHGVFGSEVLFSAGNYPFAVACGDFDKDGNTDLAVSNVSSNNVSILLGNGAGSFGTATNFTVGTQPYWIHAADVNADGNIDLVTANTASNNISVLMGLGTGSFATGLNLAAGNQPSCVSSGDFNGDGNMDIACANYADTTVSVFAGTGTGSFSPAADHQVLFKPSALATADLNEDGLTDLVTVSNLSSNIVTLTASGSGNFNPAVAHAISNVAALLLTADLNYDGHIDIVASIPGSDVVLAGNGQGNFAAPVYFTVSGPSNQGITKGDFDLDGKPDLASGTNNFGNPYRVCVLINCHDTTVCFGSPVLKASSVYTGRLILADINNDGNTDAIEADGPNAGVAIYTGDGAGNFTNSQSVTSSAPTNCVAADLNNDGHTDLAFADNGWNSASIRLNNGSGSFPTYTNFATGAAPAWIVAADLNKDGNQDLATANTGANNITVLLGNGTGSFTTANFPTDAFPQSITCADLNGDGNPDLVTSNNGTVKDLSVLLGDGMGNFAAPISYLNGGNPVQVIAADLNGDAKHDLVTVNENSNNIAVRLGTGSGTFGSAVYYGTDINPLSIECADLNLDGIQDIYTLNQKTGSAPSTISVFAGVGDGTFGVPVTYTLTYTGMMGVASGDFNNDNKIDLLAGGGFLLELAGCWTPPPCIASVTDSLYKDVQPLTWDLVPHYSAQVNSATWYWGDGTSSTGLYPSHTYTAAGWYSICVKVYTSCGDSASTCRTQDSLYRMASNNSMVQVNVIQSSSSVQAVVAAGEITIFPNPANDQLVIANPAGQTQRVQFYNLTGACVLQMDLEPGQRINTRALPEGVYCATIRWNGGLAHKKIIIAH